MSSTFGLLETARSGLNAAQLGMNITGQNIANSGTDGYTRQTLNVSSIAPDSGAYRYLQSSLKVGQGVSVNGVNQIRNNFLDIRYRDQNSDYSMWNGMESQLTTIEDYFTEISDSTTTSNTLTGLSGQLEDIYTSLKNYQTNPDNTDLSADVCNKVEMLAQSIRQDASELTTTMDRENSELGIIVKGGSGDTSSSTDAGGINGMISGLQSLNTEIASYEITGQTANDLRDQRNLLLDKLSSDLDIETTEQTNGMVTVKLKGDSTSIIDASNNINQFQIGTDSTSGSTVLQWQSSDASVNGKTAVVKGGLVKAYLNVMNGDGSGTDDPATGQCGNLGIPYLEKKLNNFAIGLYDVLNNLNNQTISADKITAGTKLITYDGDSTGVSDPTTNGANKAKADPLYVASSIKVSSEWSTDPDYFIKSYTGSDKGLFYTNYSNAMENKDGTTPTSVDGSTYYAGSLSGFADSFTQDIASSVSVISDKADWLKTNVDNLDQQRESISSVSTNDEGVNIIKYQQAYNANARVITAIDEMLDKLINSTGTVGA